MSGDDILNNYQQESIFKNHIQKIKVYATNIRLLCNFKDALRKSISFEQSDFNRIIRNSLDKIRNFLKYLVGQSEVPCIFSLSIHNGFKSKNYFENN